MDHETGGLSTTYLGRQFKLKWNIILTTTAIKDN